MTTLETYIELFLIGWLIKLSVQTFQPLIARLNLDKEKKEPAKPELDPYVAVDVDEVIIIFVVPKF